MQWKGTLEGKAGDVASLEVNRSDTSDFTFHTFGLTLKQNEQHVLGDFRLNMTMNWTMKHKNLT